MNNLFTGYATWLKSSPDDNGNVLLGEYADRIFCRKHQRKSIAQKTGGGTVVYRAFALALISSDRKAKLIVPDDGIIWNGEEYSVVSTSLVPSTRSLGAEDIIIYLE